MEECLATSRGGMVEDDDRARWLRVLRKNGREERRSAGVATIDGGAVMEARSSGAATARGGDRGHGGHGTEAQQLLGEEPPWTVALKAVVVQGTAAQRRSGWRRGRRRRYD
ncbi:LTA synthase family protein [Sesbania bispinosa]|nr:LTA synthase family protein [Sesbania bispinosa]